MSLVIFAFGLVVFLISAYCNVVLGGELLTGRRLDEQPQLVPATSRPQSATAGIDRARVLVRSEF
ncbi:MAG TPA: hypothetical protein VES40_04700 [Ilumatobacteraceae bacterium]|nr:hypothetical protein [Ilumatobacteraceae bacterium]